MATSLEVIQYLRPNGGWVLMGNEYEGISFFESEPFTKKEFEEAFPKCDLFLEKQKLEKLQEKAALLEKLGISESEVALLLS